MANCAEGKPKEKGGWGWSEGHKDKDEDKDTRSEIVLRVLKPVGAQASK